MALIKCNECGKEISDKAKVCVNCGCPITIEKKKKEKENIKLYNNKNFSYIIISLFVAIIIFLLVLETTFDNFFVSLIVSILYFLLNIYLIKKFQKKDKITKKYIYTRLAVIFVPLIIVIFIMNLSESWKYNNFSSAYDSNEDFVFYSLNLNVFGNCYYYYNNSDKDTTIYSSKCNYEKSGIRYTFYVSYQGNDKTSFDCELTNGKLKCPLRYTYPLKYVYLEKQ